MWTAKCHFVDDSVCLDLLDDLLDGRECDDMMTSSNGYIFRVTGPLCGELPSQRQVTRSFDVFFDLCLNKQLCKQS